MNIVALLAGLFSGIIGSMGLGGGAVLLIYLTLFADVKQQTAQGINLLFFIPIAVVSVIIYTTKGQIKWKTALKIAAWGLVGAVVGLTVTSYLGGEITAKVFGGLLVLMGVKEIFAKSVAQGNEKCYTKKE